MSNQKGGRRLAYNESQGYMGISIYSYLSNREDLRKKITVTTLNLSIEAFVWKLKTFLDQLDIHLNVIPKNSQRRNPSNDHR